MRRNWLSVVCVVLVATGASCGSDATSSSSASPTTAASSTASSATVGSWTATTSTTGPPTSAPGSGSQTTISGTNPCATAQLHITLGDTDGAAGNQYTPIVFTNSGPSTCTLDGHPGVSFVDAAGNQVGESAQRTADTTPTVTLAVGAQAHATIDYHDPGFFDDCAPAPTVSVKIYPPDQTDAVALPFPSSLCTTPTSEPELTIDTVRPGPTLTAGEPG